MGIERKKGRTVPVVYHCTELFRDLMAILSLYIRNVLLRGFLLVLEKIFITKKTGKKRGLKLLMEGICIVAVHHWTIRLGYDGKKPSPGKPGCILTRFVLHCLCCSFLLDWRLLVIVGFTSNSGDSGRLCVVLCVWVLCFITWHEFLIYDRDEWSTWWSIGNRPKGWCVRFSCGWRWYLKKWEFRTLISIWCAIKRPKPDEDGYFHNYANCIFSCS